MDKQKAFDIAVGGIIAQGQLCMDDGGNCQLRTTTISGKVLRCAIGQFIPEEKYKQEMEDDSSMQNLASDDIKEKSFYPCICESVGEVETTDDAALLDSLQCIHDYADDLENAVEMYRNYAEAHNLSKKVFEGQDNG